MQTAPDDKRAIRQIHSAWIDAINAGDLGTLIGLMADDVVFLTPGRAPVGRNDFPAGFLAAHQTSLIRCVSELQEVAVIGDVAYTLSRDSLSVTPRTGGASMQLTGNRMTIYRKHEGRWLLARDAHTLANER